jgi:hypothetical protein
LRKNVPGASTSTPGAALSDSLASAQNFVAATLSLSKAWVALGVELQAVAVVAFSDDPSPQRIFAVPLKVRLRVDDGLGFTVAGGALVTDDAAMPRASLLSVPMPRRQVPEDAVPQLVAAAAAMTSDEPVLRVQPYWRAAPMLRMDDAALGFTVAAALAPPDDPPVRFRLAPPLVPARLFTDLALGFPVVTVFDDGRMNRPAPVWTTLFTRRGYPDEATLAAVAPTLTVFDDGRPPQLPPPAPPLTRRPVPDDVALGFPAVTVFDDGRVVRTLATWPPPFTRRGYADEGLAGGAVPTISVFEDGRTIRGLPVFPPAFTRRPPWVEAAMGFPVITVFDDGRAIRRVPSYPPGFTGRAFVDDTVRLPPLPFPVEDGRLWVRLLVRPYLAPLRDDALIWVPPPPTLLEDRLVVRAKPVWPGFTGRSFVDDTAVLPPLPLPALEDGRLLVYPFQRLVARPWGRPAWDDALIYIFIPAPLSREPTYVLLAVVGTQVLMPGVGTTVIILTDGRAGTVVLT